MQYNLCNTIYAIQFMQYNLCNTIYAIQFMQYNLCNTIYAMQFMSAPRILWSSPCTCSHKWWETEKYSIFGVKLSIPALRGSEMAWWWHLLRKPHYWALSLTASSVEGSSSLLCYVSLSLGAILRFSGLLSSCVCFLFLKHMGVLVLWVYFLFLKRRLLETKHNV